MKKYICSPFWNSKMTCWNHFHVQFFYWTTYQSIGLAQSNDAICIYELLNSWQPNIVNYSFIITKIHVRIYGWNLLCALSRLHKLIKFHACHIDCPFQALKFSKELVIQLLCPNKLLWRQPLPLWLVTIHFLIYMLQAWNGWQLFTRICSHYFHESKALQYDVRGWEQKYFENCTTTLERNPS